MASKIFETILERKIDIFVGTYSDDSSSLFKNSDNKLIHPGEYGMYREQAFKEFLRYIISKDMDIADGFVITSKDEISTQCDIIIYNHNAIPLIDNNIAKFYPIEEVNAIGEIKSELKYDEFKTALIKLAKNKMLCKNRINITKGGPIENTVITSFLVCKKLKFDILNTNYDNIYKDIPRIYWHNIILSVDDGLLAYNYRFNDLHPLLLQLIMKTGVDMSKGSITYAYPLFMINEEIYHNCQPFFSKAEIDNKYKHFKLFISLFKYTLDQVTRSSADTVIYLGLND